jgi:hypothetical protein
MESEQVPFNFLRDQEACIDNDVSIVHPAAVENLLFVYPRFASVFGDEPFILQGQQDYNRFSVRVYSRS